MKWNNFNTHGLDEDRAFEAMCTLLFEKWCRREYCEKVEKFITVNGAGGDGGVEAYAALTDGSVIAVQAKWFRDQLTPSRFKQIENSIETALVVRPNIRKYIVCIPRDLTSTRKVKGNRNTAKPEDARWEELISKYREIYSGTEIELWSESRIFVELQRKESDGCRLYWFERFEVSRDVLEAAFSKAKFGWANTRYVSELYSQGRIHDIVTSFVGSKERAEKAIRSISNVMDELSRLKWILIGLMDIIDPSGKNQVASHLKRLSSSAKEQYEEFNKIKDLISNGEAVCKKDIEKIVKAHPLPSVDAHIEVSNLEKECSSHIHELRVILRELPELIDKCMGLIKSPDGNKLIITGAPGTGKTCGIVGEIEILFQEGIHLPILVHARDFRQGNYWRDIITTSLGLSTVWGEEELFQALETAAYVNQCQYDSKNIDDQKPKVQSNIIICVDGLDECYPYSYWEDRIGETAAFIESHKRIKFVFLSRPYALGSDRGFGYDNVRREIPNNGDVDLDLLFDKYTEHFKIDLGGNYWIKEVLDTPLSVKLFCEINKNASIKSINANSLIITELFKKKIGSLESEYDKKSHCMGSKYIVYTALVRLSRRFSKEREISYRDISCDFSEYTREEISSVLELLSNHGFIYERTKQSNNILCVPEVYYSWGMQPAMDYLVASQLKQQLEQGTEIAERYEQGVYQMLALLLLEENGKLLPGYKNLLTEIKDDDVYESTCYALSHANHAVTKEYSDYTYSMMAENPLRFRHIVNKIILPCTRILKHPLGISLLDKYLRSFRLPADRDIWWSIPCNLPGAYHETGTSLESVDFENYPLKSTMSHEGYPLLYVWLLSSVDNRIRYKARISLTRWGIDKQDEFISLFESCVTINDPQIKADLFSIAYGIALSPKSGNVYLKKIGAWIINNVFSENGLQLFCDADVRYYCRGIIDISFAKGICGKEALEIAHPPYHIKDKTIAVDVQAASSVGTGYGYSTISYYLDRFVLMGSYNDICNKYGQSQDFKVEAKNLLDSEKEIYGLAELTPHGFVISAAYKFLLNQGWDEKRFRGYGQGYGIDDAIEKAYSPATHGAQSTVMSVGEKYVWCAKSKIMAFFADITNIYGGKNRKRHLDDYAELTTYVNPYQDSMNELNKDRSAQAIHIGNMALHNYSDYSSDTIDDFMKKRPLPDFDEWISKNDSSTLMYTNTVFENDAGGVEQLYISSGLVEDDKFNEFLSSVEHDTTTMLKMLNVLDFTSRQFSHYCTPVELCSIVHGEERNAELHLDVKVPVYKAVSQCVTKYGMANEKEFTLPSKLLREAIGIASGDGYQYYDKSNSIICEYKECYIDLYNKQDYLIVNTEELKKGIEKCKLKLFWLFRIVRRPTRNALERFPNIKNEFDNTFLVWYEKNRCKHAYIKDKGYRPNYNIPFREHCDRENLGATKEIMNSQREFKKSSS